LNST
jgi:hypothetical protein